MIEYLIIYYQLLILQNIYGLQTISIIFFVILFVLVLSVKWQMSEELEKLRKMLKALMKEAE